MRSECLRVPRAIVAEIVSNLCPGVVEAGGSCRGSLTCLKLSGVHGTVRGLNMFEWSLLWPDYKLSHRIVFNFFVTAITPHHCPSVFQPFSSFSRGSFYHIPTGCKLGGKRRQVAAWDLRPAEGKAWHSHGVFQFND